MTTAATTTEPLQDLPVPERYAALDQALRRAYFNEDRADEPVYLDLDAEMLDDAAAAVGTSREVFLTSLADVTRQLLVLDRHGTSVFSRFDRGLGDWRRRMRAGATLASPPVIGLLTVFTHAAEQMGEAGTDGVHESAYYPRLCSMLGVPDSKRDRFKSAFRDSSEGYWNALATWLEANDGAYGLPTAYALSHRYVGLPISQALVRTAERKQLRRMFEDMALPANGPISHMDMAANLDQWINSERSPASNNLRGLWNNARDQVINVAVVEFESWDGTVSRNHGRAMVDAPVRAVRLAISPVTDIFSTRYEVAAIVPAPMGEARYSIDTEEGPVEAPYVSVTPTLHALPLAQAGIGGDTALSGILRVGDGSRSIIRYPRTIVPFAWDERMNIYVESERLAAGNRAALLVQNDDDLQSRVAQVLEQIARPGFAIHAGPEHQLPHGWTLYEDVHVLRAPDGQQIGGALAALEPRLSMQMTLTGGFRLPGRVSRWSRLDLPDISVVSDDNVEYTIMLEDRDDEKKRKPVGSGPAPLVVPLSAQAIADGDYTLVLQKGNTRLQTLPLRVRSSDTPNPLSWEKVGDLAHDSADVLWPLRAIAGATDPVVDGALALASPLRAVLPAASREPTSDWKAGTEDSAVRHVTTKRLPIPAESSCIQTGAHRFMLPTFEGKPTSPYITGQCGACGMSKRFPSYGRAKSQAPTVQYEARPLPATEPRGTDWVAAIDTLVYLGTGSRSDLSSIARQLENSAIFERDFIRSLEALAVIETARDDSLDVTGFEVAATSLAQLCDGSTLLTGAWSRKARASVLSAAKARGFETEYVEFDSARLPLLRASTDVAQTLVEEVDVAPDAGFELLLRLPNLSSVIDGLERFPNTLMPGRTALYSPTTDTWVTTDNDTVAGAYRQTIGWGQRYVVRYGSDLPEGTYRIVTVEVAKHLGAWMAGRPLLRYDARLQRLSVPLSAPLPGLYERAAVLCSGELPMTDRAAWALHYDEISPDFASQLIARLT